MNLTTILIQSIKGNIIAIKDYFFAICFSVMIFFMMSMLLHHPEMPLETFNESFQIVAHISNIIAFVFLAIFIFYSAYNYIKKRSREYGMYKILGMKDQQLDFLFLGENLIIYFFAILIGSGFGFLLEKLFFMIVARIFDTDNIPLYVPLKAIKEVFIYFISIAVFISMIALFILKNKELKKILTFNIQEQKTPKVNFFLSCCAILLIAVGYFLACTMNKDSFLTLTLPCVLTVLIGSYLFYHQFCSFILKKIKNNKKFYYRGINTLWVSDLAFRIKDSSTVLFLTTTMMSVGLVILCSIFTITNNKLNFKPKNYYPLTIIVNNQNSINSASQIELLFHHKKINYQRKDIKGLLLQNQQNLFFIPASAAEKLFPKHLNLFTNLQDQTIYSFLFSSKQKKKKTKEHLSLKNVKKTFEVVTLPYNKISNSLPSLRLMVVSDKTYSSFKMNSIPITINLFEHEPANSCGKELVKISNEFSKKNRKFRFLRFNSTTANITLYKYSIRFYLFISISLAFLFFICTSSMLYFKFFNHLKTESIKYGNFYKLGLAPKEIRKSSLIQMAILFFLPNILAISNTAIALVAFNTLTDNSLHILKPASEILCVVLFIQILYFFLLQNKYNKQLFKLLH